MRLARHAAAGAVAGVVGTGAMDLLLYRRYRRDGGKESFRDWELGTGVTNWNQASAPGQLGRKLARIVTGDEPPDEWARPATNIVHWATGVGWGALYGVFASRRTRHPWLRAVDFGPAVWLSGYVVLPAAGVYKPIWDYDTQTLAKDLSAHLVYGATTSAVFALLSLWRP